MLPSLTISKRGTKEPNNQQEESVDTSLRKKGGGGGGGLRAAKAWHKVNIPADPGERNWRIVQQFSKVFQFVHVYNRTWKTNIYKLNHFSTKLRS
jgi:hypothetical protein